jgi:hypothetical protein
MSIGNTNSMSSTDLLQAYMYMVVLSFQPSPRQSVHHEVINQHLLVLLLGIFRRVPCPAATRGHPCAFLLPSGRPAPKQNFFNFVYC